MKLAKSSVLSIYKVVLGLGHRPEFHQAHQGPLWQEVLSRSKTHIIERSKKVKTLHIFMNLPFPISIIYIFSVNEYLFNFDQLLSNKPCFLHAYLFGNRHFEKLCHQKFYVIIPSSGSTVTYCVTSECSVRPLSLKRPLFPSWHCKTNSL